MLIHDDNNDERHICDWSFTTKLLLFSYSYLNIFVVDLLNKMNEFFNGVGKFIHSKNK